MIYGYISIALAAALIGALYWVCRLKRKVLWLRRSRDISDKAWANVYDGAMNDYRSLAKTAYVRDGRAFRKFHKDGWFTGYDYPNAHLKGISARKKP